MALGGVLIVPVGWVLARVLRIAHPFRSALLGPVLLLVFRNAVALVVSHPRPNHALLGFTVLAVMSYSGAAVLTRTVSLIPRIIAAGLVCACVITTSTIEARQVEARERKHREQLIADFDKSVPLAVPDVVPGRMLVKVWTIDGVGHQAKSVLALDYAKEPDSGPDVMVRITENGDPRESCLAWVQGNTDGCERLAPDRWLTHSNGRTVLFAMVGRRLVEVDSTTLSRNETLAAGSKLRPVTAEYFVDFKPPKR
ncbi:hypothetical protein OIE66_41735 [Nonomuraea sp. NBC_01738]|uniref:hypothetical protein n=1 Tax=Nonomuraea sp. NBC_01738 TaxID=2976003 RepID=UPI002E1470F9|nr:hypothetical protein OIE66_41735 [Nonomuraea sp. NBC_01738]